MATAWQLHGNCVAEGIMELAQKPLLLLGGLIRFTWWSAQLKCSSLAIKKKQLPVENLISLHKTFAQGMSKRSEGALI